MWRPVITGYVHSYTEIRDNWSVEDLMDFLEQLDMKNDLEEEARPKFDGGVDG